MALVKSKRNTGEKRQRAGRAGAAQPPAGPLPQVIRPPLRNRPWAWAAAAILAAVAFVAYLPSLSNGFINWDDDKYVTENPFLRHGLTRESFEWSFTSRVYCSNWHPLTWLAHAADISIWGLNRPRGHHLVNLLLHAANTGLLVLLLQRLTRRFWPTIIVAALFALHPLHVESVTWVAERKDVLSTFWMFLALWAYVAYAERPAWWRYGLVVLAFATALLSKPMAVTLPLVMLLVDYWPLNRLSWKSVFEKVPLLLLSAASCYLTYKAQEAGGAVREMLPFDQRLIHAVYAYVMYLAKMFWPYPGTLVPFYPLPDRGGRQIPAWLVAVFLWLLLLVTALVAISYRKRPYLLVGWLIYLGMLVPVIGLVQVGKQVMADRYTYMPLVGIFVALVWLADSLVARWRAVAAACVAVGLLICAGLGVLTWRQQTLWRDSVTLWTFVTDIYPESSAAQNNLGHAYASLRPPNTFLAIECYKAAVESEPNDYMAWSNLANNLMKTERYEEAAKAFLRSLQLKEGYAHSHNGYGSLLMTLKRPDEALPHFQRALEVDPQYYPARLNLGAVKAAKRDFDGAAEIYLEMIKEGLLLDRAWQNLGEVRRMQGREAEAQECFRKAQQYRPRASAAKAD